MWKIEYTKRFLKELSKLPKETRAKAEEIIFEDILSANPFDLGYPDKYKIRIGRYRVGITIDKTNKLLICQRIVHRKDIYRVFP